MAKITVPHSLLDASDSILEEATKALAKGATVENIGDDALYTITNRKLELSMAKTLHGVGCTVEQYPLFIEVDPSAVVPTGIVDADGTLTWDQWRLSNHDILTRDSRTFIGTNAHTENDLPLSELTPVMDDLIHPDDLPAPDEDPI